MCTERIELKLTKEERADMRKAFDGTSVLPRKLAAFINKECGTVVVKFNPRKSDGRRSRLRKSSKHYDENMLMRSFALISGKAKCCPGDIFDQETGVAIAKARFFCKMLSALHRYVSYEVSEWQKNLDAIEDIKSRVCINDR